MNKDALIRKLGEALVLSHTYNLCNSDKISEGLVEYQKYLDTQELSAGELLVHAYARGEACGGSVQWEDLNEAYARAKKELGEQRVAEIEAVYAVEEEDDPAPIRTNTGATALTDQQREDAQDLS